MPLSRRLYSVRPFPKPQPEELMSLIPKSDIWETADKFIENAHFVLFIDMPLEDDEQGMIVKPLHIGEYTPRQFRKMLNRLAVKQGQANMLAQLYRDATNAANAQLYTPAPPARMVHVQATRAVPWPDEWRRI